MKKTALCLFLVLLFTVMSGCSPKSTNQNNQVANTDSKGAVESTAQDKDSKISSDNKTVEAKIQEKDSIADTDNKGSNNEISAKTDQNADVSNKPVAVKEDFKVPSVYPNVFKGYFKNTDYSSPGDFLYYGEQTKTNQEIKDIAKQFNDNKDISTLKEIFKWIHENLKIGEAEKFGRTSIDIIHSRMFTGCTDLGLAFASLAREKGIPTVFVQTGRIDWIEEHVKDPDKKIGISGHILVEVYLDNQWYLIDSTRGKLYLEYDKNNFSLPDGYYVFAKSIEVWDSGVKNNNENSKAMNSLFRKFDISKYVNPMYDYIDLLTGSKRKSSEFKGNSLVIGNAAVILGAKETAELLYSRYFNELQCIMAGEGFVAEKDLTTAPFLIELYSRDRQVPNFLYEYLPDLKTGKNGIYKSDIEGQIRVVIIEDTKEKLLEVIDGLPDDFIN